MLIAKLAVLFQLQPLGVGALIFFGNVIALLTSGASQGNCNAHLTASSLSLSLSRSKGGMLLNRF